jgi:hypothetical protein
MRASVGGRVRMAVWDTVSFVNFDRELNTAAGRCMMPVPESESSDSWLRRCSPLSSWEVKDLYEASLRPLPCEVDAPGLG